MKEIVMGICAAAVATGVFSLLAPKSSFRKQLSFLCATFLLLTAVNSVRKGSLNLDDLYKSFEEKSVYVDFSHEAEQMTRLEIANALCRNTEELLEKNSIDFEDVSVIIDISDDNCISIKQIRLVFSAENAEMAVIAENIIKQEVGDETQIVSEVISSRR